MCWYRWGGLSLVLPGRRKYRKGVDKLIRPQNIMGETQLPQVDSYPVYRAIPSSANYHEAAYAFQRTCIPGVPRTR